MIYVFDTSSFVVFKNFYPSRFPTLRKNIEQLVKGKRLISTREVLKELESREVEDFILGWAKSRKDLFPIPRIDAPIVNLNCTGLILEWVVTVDSHPRIRVLGHA